MCGADRAALSDLTLKRSRRPRGGAHLHIMPLLAATTTAAAPTPATQTADSLSLDINQELLLAEQKLLSLTKELL